MKRQFLSVGQHRCDESRMAYVYPVISRRTGGLSIGVNLNTNQACNWACVYCQVENLRRGLPTPVSLDLLEEELSVLLQDVLWGGYLERHVPKAYRQLTDIAFSGEGEPTCSAEFSQAVSRVVAVLERFGLGGKAEKKLPLLLITNGSLIHKKEVLAGLAILGASGGEVWFKVDRAAPSERYAVNKTRLSTKRVQDNLRQCAALVPTWVQTCWFSQEGLPDENSKNAYLEFLKEVADVVCGVHLYGLARPSCQPEAHKLKPFSAKEMEGWGRQIGIKTGLRVHISP